MYIDGREYGCRDGCLDGDFAGCLNIQLKKLNSTVTSIVLMYIDGREYGCRDGCFNGDLVGKCNFNL